MQVQRIGQKRHVKKQEANRVIRHECNNVKTFTISTGSVQQRILMKGRDVL